MIQICRDCEDEFDPRHPYHARNGYIDQCGRCAEDEEGDRVIAVEEPPVNKASCEITIVHPEALTGGMGRYVRDNQHPGGPLGARRTDEVSTISLTSPLRSPLERCTEEIEMDHVAKDMIIHLVGCERYEAQTFRVVEIYDGGEWCDLETLPHQNVHGDTLQNEDEIAAAYDVEVATLETTVAPQGAVCAKRTVEAGVTWIAAKPDAVVHQMGETGPSCNRKLIHDKTMEAGRWDPWLRMECPEKSTTSIWLPTHRAVTCKGCLRKMNQES